MNVSIEEVVIQVFSAIGIGLLECTDAEKMFALAQRYNRVKAVMIEDPEGPFSSSDLAQLVAIIDRDPRKTVLELSESNLAVFESVVNP